MNKIKQNISKLLLGGILMLSLFAGVSTVSAASDPANAPSNWAFDASSVELNDAIIQAYPTLDNGSGFVTIPSANAMTGTLNIASKNIGGTINGVENFTNVTLLLLNNNQFTGSIPSNIGNLSLLQKFRLQGNQLTGNIPSSITNLTNLDELLLFANKLDGEVPPTIGNLNNLITLRLDSNQLTGTIPNSIGSLTSLVELSLHNNQLSGTLPLSIGDLSSLARLNLRNNQLTNEIPLSIGNLSNLVNFNIQDNNINGVIPSTMYMLPLLEKVELQNNIDLTGNPAVGFASSTTLNYLDIRNTNIIQASPEIATLSYTIGTFLYDNLADELLIDSKTSLADGVTQETIDKAQESADFITNSTIKQQWQDDIDLAQKMLNAKNKVDSLLTFPDLANLGPNITSDDINEAQDLVNKIPSGTLKDDLQAKIETAKKLLDAENKVGSLFNPDGSLAANVDQNKIDEAQSAVNALPNGITKDILQSLINLAQNKLNSSVKDVELSKPSEIVTVTKEGNSVVNTKDESNALLLIGLLTTSMAVIAIARRRKVSN